MAYNWFETNSDNCPKDDVEVFRFHTTAKQVERHVLLELTRAKLPRDVPDISDVKNWSDGVLLEKLLTELFNFQQKMTRPKPLRRQRLIEYRIERCFKYLERVMNLTFVEKTIDVYMRDKVLERVLLKHLIVDQLQDRYSDHLGPEELLCAWVNDNLPYKASKVKNFTTDWKDGTALAGLLYRKSLGEHFRDWNVQMDPKSKFVSLMKNIRLVFSGVERLLEEGDFLLELVTKTSLMLYISQFIHARYTPSHYGNIKGQLEKVPDDVYEVVVDDEPTQMMRSVTPRQKDIQGLVEKECKDLKDYHVNPDCLILGEKIGQGAFGIVYKARLKRANGTFMVAAKTLKDDSSPLSLIKESRTLSNFKHCNVVGFEGYTVKRNLYFILQELLDMNVLDYLESSKTSLRHLDLNKIVLDVAEGMDYISSLEFVHRDLAARNCMYDKRKNLIKVGDFGFARDNFIKDYEMGSDGGLPFRWCPPEVLKSKEYSVKSDVWSFGVVFWEVHSYGERPYSDMDTSVAVALFLNKNRLKQPAESTDEEYEIMQMCWEKDAIKRPTFIELVSFLKELCNPPTIAKKPELRVKEEYQNDSHMIGRHVSWHGSSFKNINF